MKVFEAVATGQTPRRSRSAAAVTTYRYLRLAMVGMVLGLGVSVVHEVLRVGGDCWQPSLSGYYFTPVQNVFVGALVTIGVCLVALKGSTDWEDVLLNLAGICAPFVAFVPTRDLNGCGLLPGDLDQTLQVDNSIVALLAVLGAGLVTLAVVTSRRREAGDPSVPTRIERLGYAMSVLLYVAAGVFWLQREWFDAYGHQVAAIAMFSFVFLDVVLNAVNLWFQRRHTAAPVHRLNRYTWIALAMAAAVVTNLLLAAAGVDSWVLTLEASLIACFGVFWLLQTWELWDQGLRSHGGEGQPACSSVG